MEDLVKLQEEMKELGIDFNPNENINLKDDMDVDIVMHQKKKINLKFLLIFPIMILFILVLLSVSILSTNKLIPENVIGSSFEIAGFSIVPNEYSFSTRDLNNNSTVIYSTIDTKINGPFVTNYKVGKISKIDGTHVYIEQPTEQEDIRITTFDILFVVKPE